MLFIFVSFGVDNTAHAQEKSRYEKIQEKKNKANRRLKRRGDKAKKARLPFWKFRNKSRQGDKAYKGDIAGRKVRSRISPTRRSRAAYPQPNPYAGRKFRSEASRAKAFNRAIRYSKKPRERAWKGDISGSKIRNKGFRSERRRLTPQTNPYFGRRKGTGEQDGARFSGQGFKGIRSISGRTKDALKKKRITPRSSSGAFTVRKRKKPYAFRERSKWESAFQGDITGRKFQTKRTEERPIIQKPPKIKYSFQGKGRRGDRAYKGQITGGYKSATSGKERAWKGDISGTKLRLRTSERPKFKQTGINYKTAGRKMERISKALPQKLPGASTQKAIRFQGNIKATKPLKGGGSISGRWNNNGKPIQGKGFREQDQRIAKFQGNLKGGKPRKGGGSISGERWNNNGRAIQGRGYRDQDEQVAKFQGNIKSGKPLKGGGSISGKRWNNSGKPIQGRGYRDQDQRIAKFQGNVKVGDKSRKQDRKIAGFSGNIKQWKYQTGPLDEMKYEGRFKRTSKYIKNPNAADGAVRIRRPNLDRNIANYTGNIKQWKYKTGPLDEMKYEGRFKRTSKYKRNPNAADNALLSKVSKKAQDRDIAKFQGRYKLSANYKKNPNAADEALPTRVAKGANDKKMADFQGRFKLTTNYKRNPNSSKEALPGRAPLSATSKAMRFQGRFKATANYRKRPHAADGALKGIGPSKAAISASNYQGNIKMKKGRFGDRHPSYKFDGKPQDNVMAKTKFSLKVLWSKLFKKNENQPQHLKEKPRKPRYDKGEEGLWNE